MLSFTGSSPASTAALTLQHALVGAGFGDLREVVRVERVLRDVHAIEPGRLQVLGAPGEEGPVRRQRHLHRVGRALDDLFEVLSEHGLAARELHRVDAVPLDDFQKADHVVGGHLVVARLHRPPRVA